MEKYKIGITVWDNDNQLFETKVGLNDKKLTLLYSVWGKNEAESRSKADELVWLLSKVEIK